MPVETQHVEFVATIPKWDRMRAVLGGEDTVKAATELFLPKLTAQTPVEYDGYKMRAQFFNATARTRDGFSGMILRKPAAIKSPDSLKPFMEDCDMAGRTFETFQKTIVDEVIGVGRMGSFIDWSESEGRPFIGNYRAEQIINWRKDRINGRVLLSLLVLKESVDPTADIFGRDQSSIQYPLPTNDMVDHGNVTGPGSQPAESSQDTYDMYDPEFVEQLRVYRLVPTSETDSEVRGDAIVAVRRYAVLCEIYRKEKDKDEFKLFSSFTATRKGTPLNEIPFVFHGPRDSNCEVERPPLEDVAIVNLSHYRSSADLEHGRHFTGLPTAWIAGFPADSKMQIGSSTAWVSDNPNANAGFLEFTGQGLSALKEALEQKEFQMAVLGARMLEQSKKAAEAAETLQIRAAGEGSVLTNIATSLSQSFTQVLKWALWWYGTADLKLSEIREQVSVAMNTDFTAAHVDATKITALVNAYIRGTMSLDSLLYNFQQGELLNPARTIEEEREVIESQPPLALPLPPPGTEKAA